MVVARVIEKFHVMSNASTAARTSKRAVRPKGAAKPKAAAKAASTPRAESKQCKHAVSSSPEGYQAVAADHPAQAVRRRNHCRNRQGTRVAAAHGAGRHRWRTQEEARAQGRLRESRFGPRMGLPASPDICQMSRSRWPYPSATTGISLSGLMSNRPSMVRTMEVHLARALARSCLPVLAIALRSDADPDGFSLPTYVLEPLACQVGGSFFYAPGPSRSSTYTPVIFRTPRRMGLSAICRPWNPTVRGFGATWSAPAAPFWPLDAQVGT